MASPGVKRSPTASSRRSSRVTIDAPIVIRLDGTNADEGRAILEPHLSDKLQMQPTMLDAARTVVQLAGAR